MKNKETSAQWIAAILQARKELKKEGFSDPDLFVCFLIFALCFLAAISQTILEKIREWDF